MNVEISGMPEYLVFTAIDSVEAQPDSNAIDRIYDDFGRPIVEHPLPALGIAVLAAVVLKIGSDIFHDVVGK